MSAPTSDSLKHGGLGIWKEGVVAHAANGCRRERLGLSQNGARTDGRYWGTRESPRSYPGSLSFSSLVGPMRPGRRRTPPWVSLGEVARSVHTILRTVHRRSDRFRNCSGLRSKRSSSLNPRLGAGRCLRIQGKWMVTPPLCLVRWQWVIVAQASPERPTRSFVKKSAGVVLVGGRSLTCSWGGRVRTPASAGPEGAAPPAIRPPGRGPRSS